ncbi:MAG TPA: hypothetical protein VKB34_05105 [Povalibacter sp.]|nr:hypothetical protein [Povalibacter sp.]
MSNRMRHISLVIALGALASCVSEPQSTTQPQASGGNQPQSSGGGNAFVQFGTVSSSQPVMIDAFIPRDVLIGGNLGLHPALARHRMTRPRNAFGQSTASMSPTRPPSPVAMQHTVNMLNGRTVRILTDQRHIRVGDCVSVERIHDTANIRRRSASFCEPTNGAAVSAVDSQVMAEANACEAVKQELVNAETQEAADLATRKIELLCDG